MASKSQDSADKQFRRFVLHVIKLQHGMMEILMGNCHSVWKHLDNEEMHSLHELWNELEELLGEQETGDSPERADSEVGQG